MRHSESSTNLIYTWEVQRPNFFHMVVGNPLHGSFKRPSFFVWFWTPRDIYTGWKTSLHPLVTFHLLISGKIYLSMVTSPGVEYIPQYPVENGDASLRLPNSPLVSHPKFFSAPEIWGEPGEPSDPFVSSCSTDVVLLQVLSSSTPKRGGSVERRGADAPASRSWNFQWRSYVNKII